MATRKVDVYENGKRVVRHVFYGKDAKEAKHLERSHVKADRFLKAAIRTGLFKGIELETKRPKKS